MSEEIATESTESDETVDGEVATPEVPEDTAEAEPETFGREYVETLRAESKKNREKARTAETRVNELQLRLHTALVAAEGKLADPTDLAFRPEHLDSPEALTAAIDELLEAKPHLKTRKVTGDIGQGKRGAETKPVSLLEILNRS